MRHRRTGAGRSPGGPPGGAPTPRQGMRWAHDRRGRPRWRRGERSGRRRSAARSAAPSKSGATSTRWQAMECASSAAVWPRRCRAVADDRARRDRRLCRTGLGGRRLVEDRPEAGVRSAVTRLCRLGPHEGTGNDGLQDPVEGGHPVGTDHLEQAGPVDDPDLRPSGEEHLARAPPEIVADEVGAERAEVLGSRDRIEREPAPAAGSSRGGPAPVPPRPSWCWRSATSR